MLLIKMESTGKREKKKQFELSYKVKKRKTLGSSSNRRGKRWSQRERKTWFAEWTAGREELKRGKRDERVSVRVFKSRDRS